MSYNVTLRTRTVAGQVNILDSAKVRYVTGGVTLDVSKVVADANGKKSLKAGEFLGKITASGKYSPVKRSALSANAAAAQPNIVLDAAVLGGAARFQVGDAITVGAENHTIQAINYATNTITLAANLAGAQNAGTAVKATDGSAVAALMLAEDVDFELDKSGIFGDQVATAFDWARVLSARLPRTPDATIKTELPGISFA